MKFLWTEFCSSQLLWIGKIFQAAARSSLLYGQGQLAGDIAAHPSAGRSSQLIKRSSLMEGQRRPPHRDGYHAAPRPMTDTSVPLSAHHHTTARIVYKKFTIYASVTRRKRNKKKVLYDMHKTVKNLTQFIIKLQNWQERKLEKV
jgi:hypothetical protein